MPRVQTPASAELDQRLAKMLAAAPAGITVNSEVRTPAEQKVLWDRAVKKYGSEAEARKWVAPPGHSQHGLGHAADLAFSTPAGRAWAHANAAKFGLTFPLSNEPWHIEVVGARDGTTPSAAGAPVAAAKPLSNQQIRDYVISHYGYAASYLHDKEIGPILLDAAKRGLGSQELLGKLQATKWWKTHSDAQIEWDRVNETNPGQAKALVAGEMSRIGALAQQNGISLTSIQVHDLSVLSLRNKWNPDQLNNAMRYHAKIDPNVVKATFGPYTALAGSNPEIKTLLGQAQAKNWSQAQFDAAIQGTNWWKTTPQTARNIQLAQAGDPASAKVTQGNAHDAFVTAARNMGVPDSNPLVNKLAQQAFTEGWDDATIQRHLADLVKVDPTGAGNTGQTAITVGSLTQKAADYLVPLSPQTVQEWTQRIQRGDVPAASFDEYLKQQAKIARPWASKQLDAGLTLRQITDPQRNMIAATLEIDPNAVDFNNPKYSTLLDGQQGQDGAHGPMSLSAAQRYLRTLPDYNKTSEATSKAADSALFFATKLGRIAV